VSAFRQTRRRTRELRDTEAQDLHLPARRPHQVRRLDVAVRDALGVCRVQPVGHLHGDVHGLRRGHRPAGDLLGEGLASDVCHDDEADAVAFTDIMDGGDVGMIECRGRSGFAYEALQPIGVAWHLFDKLEDLRPLLK
jgi:hypothetical protein